MTTNPLTKKMIYVSLLTNIVVLIPICSGLFVDAFWITETYGPSSPARSILLSVYLSILIVSLGLLLFRRDPELVAPLFLVQVVYKLTTPFTVGSFTNPAVISNIFIATLHMFTLRLIFNEMQGAASYPNTALYQKDKKNSKAL